MAGFGATARPLARGVCGLLGGLLGVPRGISELAHRNVETRGKHVVRTVATAGVPVRLALPKAGFDCDTPA